MKHKAFAKHLLSVCICAALVLVCLFSIALNADAATIVDSGKCGKDVTWTLDSDGKLTISGTGPMADYDYEKSPWFLNLSVKTVVIEHGVTTIGDTAFFYCSNLSNISISNSITQIGHFSFGWCSNLTSVEIPISTTILEDYAFYGCTSLTEFTIPKNVTNIGKGAFGMCTNLESIIIPKSITAIEPETFYSCESLISVTIPDSVTIIGDEAFYSCDKLTSAVIPDSVLHIGSNAFKHCAGLTSVTIPYSVTTIKPGAFSSCFNLTKIDVQKNNPNYCNDSFGVLYNKHKTKLIQAPSRLCDTYTIPNTVITIGESSFTFCYMLFDVIIPDSVTTIESYAFYNCSSLSSITIPYSVSLIGTEAFSFCYELTEINVHKNNPNYCNDSNGVLFNKSKTSLIQAPGGINGSYTVPNSVTTIKNNAFYHCLRLESVFIPDSVISIGGDVFYNCSKLSVINIGNNVTTIGEGTFRRCTNLTTLTIPESVTSIGSYAFSYCSSLTSATIPNSVTSIGDYAFSNCSSMTAVTFEGDAPEFGNNTFYEVTATAYYPANTTWTEDKLQDYGGNITWVSYTPFEIKTQPTSKSVKDGVTAKFTVKATGKGLKYQWQYRTSSTGSWKNVSAASGKTANYSLTTAVRHHGYQYRCKITDSAGNTVTTKVVNLYVLGIKTQPASKIVKADATAKFTVKATGNGLKYQWQYKNSSTGSWKNVSAASGKTASYSLTAAVRHNGYQYRCRVTDSAGNKVYSKTVTLNVLGIKIQPVNKTVVAKKTAKFTVTAVGKGLTYQWQYRTSSSGSWKNVSAASGKTASYSLTAAVRHHGYQYRCKITDSAGNTVYTKTVNLYVLGVKTEPVSKTVKVGATAKFTVKATGKGLTYQWQYKTSDGSWKNVSAASGIKATYSLTAAARHNGYQYRCRIKDSAGNVIYSNIVKLTVKK